MIDPTLAMVLSDGGAKGAYEVGVMKAILDGAAPTTGYRPVEPGIFTGTSVGGFNAAVMASQPGVAARDTVRFLESIWRHRIARTLTNCGNGVYRVRGLPLQGLDPGCLRQPWSVALHTAADAVFFADQALRSGVTFATTGGNLVRRLSQVADVSIFFDAEPFARLVAETVSREGIRRSDRYVGISATNWNAGVLQLFESNQLASSIGHLAVLASAAIPGIFQPVQIGSTEYVDGALLVSTPLKPAIQAGAETLHVVYLDPLVSNSDLGSGSTFDVLARSYLIMASARMQHDLEVARRVNRAVEIVTRLERGQPISADSDTVDSLGNVDSVILRRGTERRRRHLSIHVYRPETDLGTGVELLNFELPNVERLIEQGYRDAITHDCERSGCTVAPAADPRSRRDPVSAGQPRTRRSRRVHHV